MRMDLMAHKGGASNQSKRSSSRGAQKRGVTNRQRANSGPLTSPLTKTRDQAAFKYLFRETSLESIQQCLESIRDQEMVEFLEEGILKIAAIMSSEAFTGLERARRELKALLPRVEEEAANARLLYDRHVETLGQLTFALGRRLDQYEEFLSKCPFTGSAEQLRGLYGQKARDISGDVRFLHVELNHWVKRFVPIRGELPKGDEGRSFLEGRITAVVDDLGLRLKEVQEILSTAIHDQLSVFDGTLTRSRLFKKDIENFMDIDHLLSWITELMSRVKEYDAERRPEQLQIVKTLLSDFRPEKFPALSGVRESDQALFSKFIPHILDYKHSAKQRGDDPMHVFLLLLGDLVRSLQQAGAEASPLDPDF
jgi:hypothetical protein